MELVIAIIAASIAAGLATTLFIAVRNNSQFRNDIHEAFLKVMSLQDQAAKDGLAIADLTHQRDRVNDFFAEKVKELDSEKAARKSVENQRDALLDEISKLNNADLSTVINERLRQLSRT